MLGTDVYRCWRTVLKGDDVTDDMLLPTGMGGVDRHPQPGLWRKKDGGGYVDGKRQEHRWLPVKIWLADDDGQPVHKWRDGLTLKAVIGTDEIDPVDVWGRCMARGKAGELLSYNAISQAEYKYYQENGRWPDEVPDAPAGIGHNNPDDDEDIFASLTREIEMENVRVSSWLDDKHEGQTAANMASNWLDGLRKIEKRITEAYEAEVSPLQAQVKAVQDRWRPLRVIAEGVKKRMAEAYAEIARKEKARLQAIADAEAAKKAAELRAIQAAERAKMEALAEKQGVHLDPALPMDEPVVVAEKVKVSFGGARGSKIGLKEYKVALVTDWNAAILHYAKSDKVREVVQKLANADAKNGVEVPGVKIVVEERV